MELYRENIVLKTPHYAYNEGNPTNLYIARYTDNNLALIVMDSDEGMNIPTTISVNLTNEIAGDGNVFIKDYSEHEDLTEALFDLGIIQAVRPVVIGFGTGYEVKLLGELPAV